MNQESTPRVMEIGPRYARTMIGGVSILSLATMEIVAIIRGADGTYFGVIALALAVIGTGAGFLITMPKKGE